MENRIPRRGAACGGALALGIAIGLAQGALAAPNWFGRAFHLGLGEASAPKAVVARYAIDTGGTFVLDRSGRGPLLKFTDSPEVWVLTAARGPRGDIIFFNDLGQPLLRTTKFGGVTVFTRTHPEGLAAAIEGPASPLRIGRLDPSQLFQRLAIASARASRAAQHLISFQALDTDAASSGVIADAAAVASEAVMQVAMTPGGRVALSRVGRIDLESGRSPDARYGRGVVSITVVPKAGLTGRPSSARIVHALRAGW